jgi:hypothetical protein
MSVTNTTSEGYLSKQKKSIARFKNNKRRFNESSEMQDNRAKRISFKTYLRELEDLEAEDDILNED